MKLARIGLAVLGAVLLAHGGLAAQGARTRTTSRPAQAMTAKVRVHVQMEERATLAPNLAGGHGASLVPAGAKAHARVVLIAKPQGTPAGFASAQVPVARVRVHLMPSGVAAQGTGASISVGRERGTTGR